jgi:hypothetical protein
MRDLSGGRSRAQSCLGDLTQAQYACDALARLRSDKKQPTHAEGYIIEKSLLTTALLLYARATSSSSGAAGERGSISLQRGQLTATQWENHQTLIELRNQAVAHVNSEHKSAGRLWHKILPFAVRQRDGRWKIASASNETTFHLETFQKLQMMIPVAHQLIFNQFNKRIAAVSQQINEAGTTEVLLISNSFDPVKEFGNLEAVMHVLQGSDSREDSFWFNEINGT